MPTAEVRLYELNKHDPRIAVWAADLVARTGSRCGVLELAKILPTINSASPVTTR